jgi:hypothetical protein
LSNDAREPDERAQREGREVQRAPGQVFLSPTRAAHTQDADALMLFLARYFGPPVMAGDDGHGFAGRSHGFGQVGEQLCRGRFLGPVETIDKNQRHFFRTYFKIIILGAAHAARPR